MLVLSRKEGQAIVIDKKITITIKQIKGSRVELAITAPEDVRVVRWELHEKEEKESS